jgi:hypothetical protein
MRFTHRETASLRRPLPNNGRLPQFYLHRPMILIPPGRSLASWSRPDQDAAFTGSLTAVMISPSTSL